MKVFFSKVVASAMLTAVLGAGCGDDGGSGDSDGALEPQADCTDLTYENFGKGFVDQYCISCHTSTMDYPVGEADEYDFDTVADIRQHGTDIIKHAVDRVDPVMPPMGLPQPMADELADFDAWLTCGAP